MALAVFVAVKDMKDLLKGKMIFIYLLLLVASAPVHHSGTFLFLSLIYTDIINITSDIIINIYNHII